MLTCVRNHYIFVELYAEALEMVCCIRSFVKFFHSGIDDDIEDKPYCFHLPPSVTRLDFLVTDIQLMLDITYHSVNDKVINDHGKFSLIFEFLIAVNRVLENFCEKYK